MDKTDTADLQSSLGIQTLQNTCAIALQTCMHLATFPHTPSTCAESVFRHGHEHAYCFHIYFYELQNAVNRYMSLALQ